MATSARIKKAFLRQAAFSKGNFGLKDALIRMQSGAFVSVQGSKIRINTSADGTSVGFTIDTGGEIKSQTDVVDLLEEILERWELFESDNTVNGTPPTEDACYKALMQGGPPYEFRAIKGTTSNWMYLSK